MPRLRLRVMYVLDEDSVSPGQAPDLARALRRASGTVTLFSQQ